MSLRVGLACGAFDLCHAGHVRYFEEARRNCDWLVVGLHVDPSLAEDEPYRIAMSGKPKNKPVQSVEEREIILRAIRHIDEIVIYRTEKELLGILQLRQFDVRFFGDDWRGKPYTGRELGHAVHYVQRVGFSSSDLRDRVVRASGPASAPATARELCAMVVVRNAQDVIAGIGLPLQRNGKPTAPGWTMGAFFPDGSIGYSRDFEVKEWGAGSGATWTEEWDPHVGDGPEYIRVIEGTLTVVLGAMEGDVVVEIDRKELRAGQSIILPDGLHRRFKGAASTVGLSVRRAH